MWLDDSGSTACMSPNPNWFTSLTKLDTPVNVSVADGHDVLAYYSGNAVVPLKSCIKLELLNEYFGTGIGLQFVLGCISN